MQNARLLLKITLLALISVFAIGLLAGCADDANGDATAPQNDGTTGIVQIEDLLNNPSQFQSTVAATGTVTTFHEQGGLTVIGIVDNDHILMCRNLDCDGLKMFGIYRGDQELPEPGDVITMAGSFQEINDVMVFFFDDYVVTNNIIDLLQ